MFMTRPFVWTDFDIGPILGTGHSGTVFRATLKRAAQNLPTGAVVALKTYKAWVIEEPAFMERLFREVAAGRTIEHAKVLRVYGSLVDSNSRAALVMEFHDGPTLDQQLDASRESCRPIEFERALHVLRDIAAGLSRLHAAGITHRDIKPTNILMTDERAVVADFGVVRSDSFPEQTTTNAFLGTIRYAAPEYLFGEAYDHSIDIYSFGCIAYELFANTETMASHRQWAGLVYAKRQTEALLSAEQLEYVMREHGGTAAEFARSVVNSSACQRKDRLLSLADFIDLVDSGQWRQLTHFENGRLVAGFGRSPDVRDRLFTPENAEQQIRACLTARKLKETAALIRLTYWVDKGIWSPQSALTRKLFNIGALAVEKAIEPPRDFYIVPSVRAAYALGLLGNTHPTSA